MSGRKKENKETRVGLTGPTAQREPDLLPSEPVGAWQPQRNRKDPWAQGKLEKRLQGEAHMLPEMSAWKHRPPSCFLPACELIP